MQPGEIVEARGGPGMVGPERGLIDGEGAGVKRFGGVMLAPVVMQPGEIVEACGGRGMVGPERGLADRQGAGIKRLGGVIFAPVAMQQRRDC